MSSEIEERFERILTQELDRHIAFGMTPNAKGLTSVLTPVIERLLTAERKKVREMCAAVAKDFCDESEPGNSVSVKYLEDKYGTLDALQAIRQLDLTKDLAASSREKGGDAKCER